MISSPDPTRRWAARGLGGPALVAIAALLVATACATGVGAGPSVASLVDPSASPGASPASSVSPEDAFLAYSSCMREHGIPIEDPKPGEGGGFRVSMRKAAGADAGEEMEKFQEAEEACRHHLADLPMGPGKGMDQATQDALLAFAKCMRENGVDMPDPVFENGGGMVRIGGPDDKRKGIDPGSATFKAAEEACRHHMPGGGRGIGGPTQVGPGDGGSEPGGGSTRGGSDEPILEVQP